MSAAKKPEGWSWLFGTRKWHYFTADGRSLCGKWLKLLMTASSLEQGCDDSPDNCAACRRKLAAQK